MSLRRLLIASLLYHARAHAAVALCVATGSAVLTGALLVGDSMRGSLRELVLERLGRIDHALVAPGLFRRALADDVRTELARAGHGGAVRVEPAMLLHGSIARIDANGREGTRVGKVDILGVTPGFWALGPSGASPDVAAVWHGDGGSEAVSLNEKLANDLGVRAGDTVLVRTEKPSAIPREAVLGRKDDAVLTRRLTVGSIVPAGALGNFALEPNQHAPRNAYVTLDALAVAVGAPGRANAIFIAGGADRPGASAPGPAPDPAAHAASPQAALARAIRLDDLGLRLRIDPARGTMSLESSRMVLVPAAGSAALEAASDLDLGVAPTLTYLANAIERLAPDGDRLGKSIPYSTVAALPVDAEPPLGPLALESGAPVFVLADDEILLNRWAADDLDAHAGDRIELSYFAAESSVPFATEQAVFRLRGVVAMQGVADDPGLVPDYPGITNAKHYADWDPPFPMDLRRVRPKDETYWDEHRGTPKAFVSLAAGERIWGSRFGRWTSVRVALPASESPVSGPGTALGSARGHAEQRGGDDPADALKDRFEHALLGHLAPEQMGLVFQPVKAQGLAASQGATDFAELFLAFSFFLIAAAVILIALVFRLAVERRAKEPGLLLAVGFDRAQVRNLLLAEGLVTATLGSLIGSAVGVLYTAAMLRGLGTWWLPAVGTSRLTLHVAPLSLAIGFFSGLMLALLAIAGTVRRLSRTTPRALLAGSVSDAAGWVPARAAWSRRIGWACLAVAAGGSAVATLGRLHPATFFLVGSCLLVGALFLLYAGMAGVAGGMVRGHGVAATLRLGVRNGGRHRGRSALTAGLVAFATFVIVAVAANRREALQDAADKRSGSGGFALVAECDPPLLHDLNARAGRRELGFPASADAAFEGVAIFPVRLRPGEDASCLNLYKPTRPRLLGVSPALIVRGVFWLDESFEV